MKKIFENLLASTNLFVILCFITLFYKTFYPFLIFLAIINLFFTLKLEKTKYKINHVFFILWCLFLAGFSDQIGDLFTCFRSE
jgi:hypothetical protein